MKSSSRRPNIVFLLSDDHSAPFAGCYGYPIHTPTLDRLASEGMRFERAFTTAPQCVPSRASLMTGLSPAAARMGRFSSPLPGDVAALPELLRTAGYFSGACRRNYHLDGSSPHRVPELNEVMERHGLKTFAPRLDFVDRSTARDDRVKTPRIVGEFLDSVPEGSPFFLWVNFNDPHHPWDEHAIPDPHDPDTIEVPAYLPDLPSVRRDLARHCDAIARMDEECGWVLDLLEQRGLAGDTLVLFMGDNGYSFPHGKGSLHDPGLHVPFIVRWPGVVEPGSSTAELFSGEDFAPTLLDAAGVDIPAKMTGISFLNLLRGDTFEGRDHIFGERGPHGNATYTVDVTSNQVDFARCVRSNRYKLIYTCMPHQHYGPVDSGGLDYWQDMMRLHTSGELPAPFEAAYFTTPRPVWELYDLQNDPAELNNLAGQPELADIEADLKSALHEKMVIDYDFLPLPKLG